MRKVDIFLRENRAGKWKNFCGGCGKPINNPTGNYCKWCGAKFSGIIYKTDANGNTETIKMPV